MLDRLERPDGPAELVADLRVGHRGVQGPGGDADALRGEGDAQGLGGGGQARRRLAGQHRGRAVDRQVRQPAGEVQGGERGGHDRAARHGQQLTAGALDEDEIRGRPVKDHRGTAACGASMVLHPGVQGHRRGECAGGDGGEVLPVTRGVQRRRGEHDARQERHARQRASELFEDDAHLGPSRARAAELLRDREAQDAHVCERPPQRGVAPALGASPPVQVAQQFLDAAAQVILLVCQRKVHGAPPGGGAHGLLVLPASTASWTPVT